MRPIDADRLLKTIESLDVECVDQKQASIMLNTIRKVFPKIVNDEPTIEAEPVHENPEIGNKESEQYCHDCIHNEVCKYYPHNGCDFKEKAEGWIDDESMPNEDMRPDNEVI